MESKPTRKYNFDVAKTTDALVDWIKEWFELNGPDCNAVIGISGGKDSTVVAALCVKALGKDRVIGVMMPEGVQRDIEDSKRVIRFLGITSYTINIQGAVQETLEELRKTGIRVTPQTKTNLPARIRMSSLYALGQSVNGRVSNNCNLSEDTVGYSTRWGDGAGDFSPLSHLTTVEIVAIGDYLGLPSDLTHKTPIDGLNVNPDGSYVTDEQSLGVSYLDIHNFLREPESLPDETWEKIEEMRKRSEFKLQLIPSFKPIREMLWE